MCQFDLTRHLLLFTKCRFGNPFRSKPTSFRNVSELICYIQIWQPFSAQDLIITMGICACLVNVCNVNVPTTVYACLVSIIVTKHRFGNPYLDSKPLFDEDVIKMIHFLYFYLFKSVLLSIIHGSRCPGA